jgi:hypothetical protein
MIRAGYAKNGQTATMSLPDDLAADLKRSVGQRPAGKPILPLTRNKGAAMVRRDLEATGIPYQTASEFLDFHSLRCELATLADPLGFASGRTTADESFQVGDDRPLYPAPHRGH